MEQARSNDEMPSNVADQNDDNKKMSAQEVAGREMVMEGVLAIQGGQNPRVIEQTLLTYLPPTEARALEAARV